MKNRINPTQLTSFNPHQANTLHLATVIMALDYRSKANNSVASNLKICKLPQFVSINL